MDSFPQGSQKQKCHSWVNFYSGEWELQMCMCVQIAFPFAPEERDTHLHQKREILIYITFQKREREICITVVRRENLLFL